MTYDRGNPPAVPTNDQGYPSAVDSRGFAPPVSLNERGFAQSGSGFAQSGSGFAPAGAGFAPPADRRPVQYVRCARCLVLQVPQHSAPARCVSCGAPMLRWVAHRPAGGPTTATRRAGPQRPYLGPPSYRGGHPRWAFPPVVWRDAPEPAAAERLDDPSGALRRASWPAAITAAAALLAAGAEIGRFALLLEGRRLVLSGDVVRTSDVLVAAGGVAVVLAAVIAVVLAVPALVRTHAVAARRLGRAPSRSGRAVLARLLAPVWNIYGAGQIVTEIDRTLTAAPDVADRPQRGSWITGAWWASWIVSGALVLVTVARGFGGSLQAIADTVELHIAVDLVAAVVAGLAVLMLRRFAGLLAPRPEGYERWVVQPPAPTRDVPDPARAEQLPQRGSTD